MGTNELGVIDAVGNLPFLPSGFLPGWSTDFAEGKLHVDGTVFTHSPTADDYLRTMDRLGVERTFLISVRAGSVSDPVSFQIPLDLVADAVLAHPDRFSGLVGLDPTAGMAAVRELDHAVNDLGFIGAHSYPHWFELAPDDARYYPLYAKCVELDVPIQLQVGHCLRYSEARPLQSVGRPITLDRVACHFPELRLIGIHTGWPWIEEMIAVAYKHPNVYIATDAYAPRHWPEALRHYIDTWGSDKVIFGTDYPVLTLERALSEITALGFEDASVRKLLRDNAVAAYRLGERA